MLKIYKTTMYEKKIKKIKRMSQDSWIDLTNPTREEINRARNWIKSAVDPYRQKTKEILSEYQENKAQIIQDN